MWLREQITIWMHVHDGASLVEGLKSALGKPNYSAASSTLVCQSTSITFKI